MMSLLASLGAIPPKIYAALAFLVLLGVVVWQIDARAYNRGWTTAEAQWLAMVQVEVARQVTANNDAWAQARLEIETLRQAKEVRNATIDRLNAEAAASDNAGSECFDIDGVRRLNHRD